MRNLIVILCLTFQGCASLYPIGGAILGGGAGSLAGPAGAAIGSGLGASAGLILAKEKDLQEAKATIVALTTGDVDKLVELKLKEKKDSGFFDSILSEVYNFFTLSLIALVAWNVVPLLYTWMSNKKVHKKINGGEDGKTEKST